MTNDKLADRFKYGIYYFQGMDENPTAFTDEERKEVEAALRTPSSGFREALIDALVVNHIYCAAHDTDPRKAVHDLLRVETQLALDPQVSRDAAALIERGFRDGIEAAAEVIISQQLQAEPAVQIWANEVIDEIRALQPGQSNDDEIIKGGTAFVMGPGDDEGTRAGRHPDSPYPIEQSGGQAETTSVPFSNCKFEICDLPGQCIGEGRCHHPREGAHPSPQGGRAELAEELRQSTIGDGEHGYCVLCDFRGGHFATCVIHRAAEALLSRPSPQSGEMVMVERKAIRTTIELLEYAENEPEAHMQASALSAHFEQLISAPQTGGRGEG